MSISRIDNRSFSYFGAFNDGRTDVQYCESGSAKVNNQHQGSVLAKAKVTGKVSVTV